MKLGISHFLLSEVRESTASDVPEKESRWSDLIAILHRIESDDSNRASRIFQDVRNIIVDFSEGGFQWHGTLDSPPRTVSENSNWAFERLSKINEVAAKESRWSDLIAIPPRMGSDDSNRGSRILQDVRNIIVNFSEGGFQWHSTLGSPPKTVSENSNWAFERLSKINEVAAKRIGDLARLQQDWDGYGGEPIAQEAINRTAGLLMIIQGLTGGKLQNPFIAPLPDGGLELEWEMDSGVELTLIVRGGGREIKYLLDVPNDSGGIEESEGLLPKDASLSELVTGLI